MNANQCILCTKKRIPSAARRNEVDGRSERVRWLARRVARGGAKAPGLFENVALPPFAPRKRLGFFPRRHLSANGCNRKTRPPTSLLSQGGAPPAPLCSIALHQQDEQDEHSAGRVSMPCQITT